MSRLHVVADCPFCGQPGRIWSGQDDWDSEWYCGCLNNDCSVKVLAEAGKKQAAVEKWNRRAGRRF